ncbi:hypothetical protein EGR_09827 [Echinococcus granulosus]|uniref:Uncharacterized protein n=1 Tax=Echinococcus granulosus TaxID=6210 RepID=W6U2G0_ECHGR|nr:hypothetical protein EGR_09827 [Echinococcus granulosus]EUB55300.1 hypothetical protein EGR_09827 [Echinococcus granulosus]
MSTMRVCDWSIEEEIILTRSFPYGVVVDICANFCIERSFHCFAWRVMVEEYEDDFDRFCRIGMGTGSEYSPVRPTHRDFLAAPTEINRNRAGSLRETRYRQHHRNDHPAMRGRFERTTTTDDFGMQGDSVYNLRRYSLAPSFQNLRTRGSLHYPSEDISDDRSNSARPFTPTRQTSPLPRNGSSGGVCPPPINVYHEVDSPGHHSTNVVRVRSFRRTKTGVIDETEKKRRLSQEFSLPARKTSKTRSLKAPSGELRLSDRCETARSIRRRSFTDNSWKGNNINNSATNVNNSNVASEASEVENGPLGQVAEPYKVQVLGADQVGKTTMCTQFLTSESLEAGYDTGKSIFVCI